MLNKKEVYMRLYDAYRAAAFDPKLEPCQSKTQEAESGYRASEVYGLSITQGNRTVVFVVNQYNQVEASGVVIEPHAASEEIPTFQLFKNLSWREAVRYSCKQSIRTFLSPKYNFSG